MAASLRNEHNEKLITFHKILQADILDQKENREDGKFKDEEISSSKLQRHIGQQWKIINA